MANFTKPLIVELNNDGKHWYVREAFSYYSEIIKKGEKVYIDVPSGWMTDFASIPKIFCLFISYRDKYNKAAVVHDYLYKKQIYSRYISDRVFNEAMKVLNIFPFKRFLFYISVRLFGWIAWLKHKKENNK